LGPMKSVSFKRLVASYDCKIVRRTKEWEVRNRADGKRISSFGIVRGQEVKSVYVQQFLKAIKIKRGIS